MNFHWMHIAMVFVFVLGYLAIIFEYKIKINKTASALMMAVLTWLLLFLSPTEFKTSVLDMHIADASQIIFFLLGAMTLVELIDSHRGFLIITDTINTNSKRKLLWLTGFISFFLSSVLDNLTTTIVMISLLRKLIPDTKDRALLGSTVVIAANAGGAWTPIGDVTTTMLWIHGQVTSLSIMKSLFLPSIFSVIITLTLLSTQLKGTYPELMIEPKRKTEPGAKRVFITGILGFLFVPIFRATTGLPPFMGILISLGFLWLMTDIMHHKHESRKHLRVPHILTRIDTSGVLFFLGILLCINSLEVVGILNAVAVWLNHHIQNLAVISTSIGLISSIVDNVPLVAACMGMYDLQTFPPDSSLWQMVAYCSGTGGSILIIGSAAGVALMGLEKIDFIWYFKKVTLTALTGYLAGMAFYLLVHVL
ncbi:MAG: sodium:proton antiporter NhaD [Parachlamydiales bacterium]|nr:sodium:proton antiporter NhaD [Parachlamydiales bacterium]